MNILETRKQCLLFFEKNTYLQKTLFITLALLCLTPLASPSVALLLGILTIQLIGHPYITLNHKAIHILLQVAVVGLGFGMNVNSALQAGKNGMLFSVVSIATTLFLELLLTKKLKIEKVTGYLIAAGTAICGGSAIAAISPIVKAKENQTSVALGVIFVLNSVALFVFPYLGHILNLSQTQFGLWCAIAIHDTSSVVGAASKYGAQALEVATTVKLARALWIIPLSVLSAVFFKNTESKIKIPYFIGLFILAMLANTYFTGVQYISAYIVHLSKAGLNLTLFLIGSGLTANVLRSVGLKTLALGVVLWFFISGMSLLVIFQIAK
ncbi:YeiH family protein [Pseudopedobacter beijingensis]|uniref:YeiH family protein n=1 Tax=Pseudopedobacter beijingensis TaxID=1207056 RepID=A0ABW4IEX6_9SPHI